ncbi:unnamed protein product [Urochloa decumbens]|uniref:Yip1 domain-containing protein n=1 Tax=Urochloa decumbens TaxID=240449 RepID=A0ABC9DVK7_9POAL
MAAAAAVPALCTAISAAQLIRLLDLHPGGGTAAAATQAQALGSAVRAFLPLVATGGLFTAVTLIHRHFRGAAAAVNAGNQRRQSEMLTLLLCVSAGLLYFVLFVAQAPGGGVDDPAGAAVREIGLAALRALPAAATVTFYLGMLLIIIRHIRAGGEGGGTAAGLLAKMAIGAAAGLVCLMAVALHGA